VNAAPADHHADLAGDAAELERLRVVFLRIARRIRASSHEGITASQRSTLATIAGLGPLTIGQIANLEHVQPPSASKIVSSLEQLGLIERHAEPADRRCSLIDLSQAGRAAVDEMRAAGRGFLAGRLAELDPADVDTLAGALPVLERLLGSSDEAHAASRPPNPRPEAVREQ
jgi:DNA-binding MarR family transcriptional regulator